jgi:hypothetical protein
MHTLLTGIETTHQTERLGDCLEVVSYVPPFSQSGPTFQVIAKEEIYMRDNLLYRQNIQISYVLLFHGVAVLGDLQEFDLFK